MINISLIKHILLTSKQIESGSFVSNRSSEVSNLNSSRILFVGMADSPHMLGWISTTKEQFPEFDIYLFPSDRPRFAQQSSFEARDGNNKLKIFRLFRNKKVNFVFYYILDTLFGLKWRAYFLAMFIKRVKPAVIHFHETQHGGYIYNLIASHGSVAGNTRNILSTWGSDFVLYSNIVNHVEQIKSCFAWADLITAERTIDETIARNLGYIGDFRAPIFITIGRNQVQTTNRILARNRKSILVKGTQDNSGRSLNILASIEQMDFDFEGYEILIYSASESVRVAAELIRATKKIDIRCLPRITKAEMQKLFSGARVSIGVGISDGLPGALVEAMENGAFPIQSRNSCADLFIDHGVNGFIVDPWNLEEIKLAIRRSLEDDVLVDHAQTANPSKLESVYSRQLGVNRLRRLYEKS